MTDMKDLTKYRRMKRVTVNPSLFGVFFVRGSGVKINIDGIPSDSEFRGFNHDTNRNILNFFYEHESWDLIHESEPVPELQINVTRIEEPAALKPLPEPN